MDMKKFLKVIGALTGLAILTVVVIIALMPWMDRWGATDNYPLPRNIIGT